MLLATFIHKYCIMDTSSRLQALIDHYRLTPSAFAVRIGVKTKQAIYDILKGRTRGLSISIESKILSAFPEVSRVWLLTGEGSMLQESGTSAPTKSFDGHGVPYYNVDFLGGFDLMFNDQTVIPEYHINFKPYDKATCWCNITGHSMEPEISHGDIIALRRIEDFTFLPLGEIYAIVTTNDMRTVKRLGPSESPDSYALIPTNKSPEYGVQTLPKDKIRCIFEVLGCMKRF